MYERLGRGFSGKHPKKKHLQRKTGAKTRTTERITMGGEIFDVPREDWKTLLGG
jgi:hypothetical protein